MSVTALGLPLKIRACDLCNAQVKLYYGAYGHCILERGHEGACFHPKQHKPAHEQKDRR